VILLALGVSSMIGKLKCGGTAAALKVSADTVTRDWRLAKAWLHGEMNKEKHDDS
jgi:hypothetical protein